MEAFLITPLYMTSIKNLKRSYPITFCLSILVMSVFYKKELKAQSFNLNRIHFDQASYQKHRTFAENGISGVGIMPQDSLAVFVKNNDSILIKQKEKIIFSGVKNHNSSNKKRQKYLFSTASHSKIIKLLLQDKPCTTAHSSQFKIRGLKYKGKSNSKILGCMEWAIDSRLHDIWMLYQIDNRVIDKKKFALHIPRLEFILNEGKIYGFDGLQEFSGNFSIQNQNIKIQSVQLVQTPSKAVNPLHFDLSKILPGNAYDYQISEGTLTLTNSQQKLIFKRTD